MNLTKLAILAALSGTSNAFVGNHWARPTRSVMSSPVFAANNEAPSDSGTQDEDPGDVNTETAEEDTSEVYETEEIPTAVSLQRLLEIGARTGRGEFASSEEKDSARNLIEALERSKPTEGVMWKDRVYGRWELVYCSTELFRSSPFFMAGRAVCTTDDQAEQYNWFCDMHRKALAVSTIGAVRQIVSPSRLVSEFEVSAGTVPFVNKFSPFAYSGGIPVAIEGAIVSSADLTIADEGDAWEILMDTVEIKGSNMPGIRQLLDTGLKLESRQLGDFLESNLAGYTNPRPVFETTYLDDSIRVSRDQDDNIFVYSKVSDNMDPTNYAGVMPDLGVARLLEGFNDAVTKIYL